jgi:hypothetical protein
MSLILTKDDCRLTVIGKGWNNASIDSGEGMTLEGDIIRGIIGDLDYEFPPGLDWNAIADDMGFDLTGLDMSYISADLADLNGLMTFTDLNGITWTNDTGLIDGLWTNDLGDILTGTPPGLLYNDDGTGNFVDPYGNQYPGTGCHVYLPESTYMGIADTIAEWVDEDSELIPYIIPEENLQAAMKDHGIGGPVDLATKPTDHTTHYFSPAVNFYNVNGDNTASVIFVKGDHLWHADNSFNPIGGEVGVSFSIHGSQARSAKWSSCNWVRACWIGFNILATLPEKFRHISSPSDPLNGYIVWQLIYGSFNNYLFAFGGDHAGDVANIHKINFAAGHARKFEVILYDDNGNPRN